MAKSEHLGQPVQFELETIEIYLPFLSLQPGPPHLIHLLRKFRQNNETSQINHFSNIIPHYLVIKKTTYQLQSQESFQQPLSFCKPNLQSTLVLLQNLKLSSL